MNPAIVDHDAPSESLPFPIVAIGASAGGLEAFQELLKTLPVDDGAGVISAATQFRPDAVLLDLRLPDVDGHRVAAELRRHAAGRAAHIIAVTGFGQAEDFRRSSEAGIDHHLVKPVEPEALLATLARGREK